MSAAASAPRLFCYREYALAAVAAQRLARPVKWIADRNEHFLGDAQGRDNVTSARLALDADGRFIALEVDLIADMGAYLSCYGPFIPYLGAGMSPGLYDIAACHVRVRGVYTNTVPVDAYRGAGRPEASYLIERLVDVAAHETRHRAGRVAAAELHRAGRDALPTATGKAYDSGDFAGHLGARRSWAIGRASGTGTRRATRGHLRGIGIATYIEACGNGGPETAIARLDPDGGITVLIGTQSTGQGHHTAYAQLIAQRLRLAPDFVRVSRATPIWWRPAPAPAARTQFPAAAPRLPAPPTSWPTVSRRSPAICWRRPRAISNSPWKPPVARSAWSAPTAPSRLRSWRGARHRATRRSRASMLSSRTPRPIPTAPIWPRSRSIPRPAPSRSSITWWSTISA